MNRAKKGEILYKDIELAFRNAFWTFNNPKPKKYIHETEASYLKTVIQKAKSRLLQIEN